MGESKWKRFKKKKNLKPTEPEKGMKRALALIAYEDILDGGGVYNN